MDQSGESLLLSGIRMPWTHAGMNLEENKFKTHAKTISPIELPTGPFSQSYGANVEIAELAQDSPDTA
jgi:hypothetical protein